jgi:2-polyprenyl-3-methyl-5-hydroxy-6-metoxy-1,4-benzoquinol methylase
MAKMKQELESADVPIPPFVRLPDRHLARRLYAAAYTLEAKLLDRQAEIAAALQGIRVDYASSEIEDPQVDPEYWSEWFVRKAGNYLSYLEVYVYILAQVVPPGRKPEQLRLLDFGGGWGLMSMLAAEAGFGSVTYLDINPGVCEVTRLVSGLLGVPLKEIICGSERALLTRNAAFEAVVSSDVLEHIYSPTALFESLERCCAPDALLFLHTGANPKNLYQRWTLTRLHRSHERRILEDRRKVLAETFPQLRKSDLERLAVATRGRNRDDVIAAGEAFLQDGSLPHPDHPSNTCDLTGYWLERMMNPFALSNELAARGFRTSVLQSFWGLGRTQGVSRLAKHVLNAASAASVAIGLRTTFYYGIFARRL